MPAYINTSRRFARLRDEAGGTHDNLHESKHKVQVQFKSAISRRCFCSSTVACRTSQKDDVVVSFLLLRGAK